jgi:signal peptidase I
MLKTVYPVTERRSRSSTVWRLLTASVFLVGLVAMGSQAASVRGYVVPSASMAPTLAMGDRLAVQPRRFATGPRRGEIWLFRAPAKASPGQNVFVKRVIGLPGETVQIRNGQVVIDGNPLPEPYLKGTSGVSSPAVTLGANEYYVLGDNRPNSNDSHVWGPLGGSRFIGRAALRYWPVERMGGL